MLVHLTTQQYRSLRMLAGGLQTSMAHLIREAIDAFTSSRVRPLSFHDIIEKTAGAWSHRHDIPDGVKYENAVRQRWVRRANRDPRG